MAATFSNHGKIITNETFWLTLFNILRCKGYHIFLYWPLICQICWRNKKGTVIFSPLNLKFGLHGENGFGSSSLVQHLTPDFLELSTYISLPNPATTTWEIIVVQYKVSKINHLIQKKQCVFIDFCKLPWSKSVKQTVSCWILCYNPCYKVLPVYSHPVSYDINTKGESKSSQNLLKYFLFVVISRNWLNFIEQHDFVFFI